MDLCIRSPLLGGLFLALLAASACASPWTEPKVDATAIFDGEATVGGAVQLEVTVGEPFPIGRGHAVGNPFALASLGPDGPVAVALTPGTGSFVARGSGSLELDATRAHILLPSLKKEATLSYSGSGSMRSEGPFAGCFSDPTGVTVLELRQWNEVIAGHGSFDGQTAVLAAMTLPGGRAAGLLLFADAQSTAVDLVVLDDEVTLQRLDSTLTLRRRPSCHAEAGAGSGAS